MKTYCISFNMDGHEYADEIKAESFEDADRRLAAIKSNGRIDGELAIKIPVPSFLGRLFHRSH